MGKVENRGENRGEKSDFFEIQPVIPSCVADESAVERFAAQLRTVLACKCLGDFFILYLRVRALFRGL